MSEERLAPLIAIVGCDGSGKSTLAADLLAHIGQTRLAMSGYLGLGSGEQGRAIGRWPLIGPALHRWLDSIADRLRDPAQPIPGMLAARYALAKSRKRRARFDALLTRRRSGVTIVTDRYPQIDVAGLHDGPILAGRATTDGQRAIQAQELALYREMAAYLPTLVIRLNVDVDTAFARKGDHARSLLSAKIAALPRLAFGGAPIVDLDATMDYPQELALAKAAVDRALAKEASSLPFP